MSSICTNCHGSNWTNSHFVKLDNTLKETDKMTATATNVMISAWEKGIEDKTNPLTSLLSRCGQASGYFIAIQSGTLRQ